MTGNDLQKEVSEIYRLISAIKVSGDAVDYVAAARTKLRNLNEDIGTYAKEAKTDGGQDNG